MLFCGCISHILAQECIKIKTISQKVSLQESRIIKRNLILLANLKLSAMLSAFLISKMLFVNSKTEPHILHISLKTFIVSNYKYGKFVVLIHPVIVLVILHDY